jgi:hypothetical protein
MHIRIFFFFCMWVGLGKGKGCTLNSAIKRIRDADVRDLDHFKPGPVVVRRKRLGERGKKRGRPGANCAADGVPGLQENGGRVRGDVAVNACDQNQTVCHFGFERWENWKIMGCRMEKKKMVVSSGLMPRSKGRGEARSLPDCDGISQSRFAIRDKQSRVCETHATLGLNNGWNKGTRGRNGRRC